MANGMDTGIIYGVISKPKLVGSSEPGLLDGICSEVAPGLPMNHALRPQDRSGRWFGVFVQ